MLLDVDHLPGRQGSALIWQTTFCPLTPEHWADLSVASFQLPHRRPYSHAVKLCQDPMASAIASFWFLPEPLPEW